MITGAMTNIAMIQMLYPLMHFFFFLLSEICDRRGLTETFLKMATLSVLVWASPHEMKTSNENFKNAAICLHSVTTEIL